MSDAPRIDAAGFDQLLREQFGAGNELSVTTEKLEFGFARLRLPFSPAYLRPGGTVSGPTIMALADTALYAAVLSVIGMQPLAVTSDLGFHFLRKAGQADLLADARVLKSGKRLVVGEVHIYAGEDTRPVARAAGSYVIPSGFEFGG